MATEDTNIGLAFRTTAAAMPEADAIIAKNLTINYGNLLLVVERFAQNMAGLGIGRGSTVAIDTSDVIVAVSSIFALSLLGARFVPLNYDFLVGDRTNVTHVLKSPEQVGAPGIKYVTMDHSWSPKHPSRTSLTTDCPGFLDDRETCWILGSSGTTGRPKFVSIDQRTLWRRVGAVAKDYGQRLTRLSMLFGCNSRPFAIRAIAALLSGNVIVDSSEPGFMARHRVNLVCGSPVQVDGWLGRRTLHPKWQRLQVSGSRLSDVDVRNLLASFETVEDVYGSNETIMAHVNVHRLNRGGVTVSGRDVGSNLEIVDEAGRICRSGQMGAVRIRNPFMVHGYDNLPDETERRFRDGWFYPGDLAHFEGDGVLRVIGRDDDVMSVSGQKVNLGDIDAVLTSGKGFPAACCFANPIPAQAGTLAACVEVRQNGESMSDMVQTTWETCARTVGPGRLPTSLLVVPKLPLTADGVPRRRECEHLFKTAIAENDTTLLDKTLFHFLSVPRA